MQKKIETVKTLLEALPYIKKFRGEKIVIKYGGSAQESQELKAKFAQDIVLLHTIGLKPVIVHGGGKSISRLLNDLGVESKFIDGQRVTTKEVMRIAEMVLSGEINKEIVALLNSQGVKAIGISGKDASFMEALPKDTDKFGYTGVITNIDIEIVEKILDDGFVPVIAPVASGGRSGHIGFNINADLVSSRVAVALKARKIVFLTDTSGVLDSRGRLISVLSIEKTKELKESGVIYGGMIPKVEASLEALRGGVKRAHIIDGRVEHSLLLEILTSSGIGTCIEL
jgi:acetylglutamate kinase